MSEVRDHTVFGPIGFTSTDHFLAEFDPKLPMNTDVVANKSGIAETNKLVWEVVDAVGITLFVNNVTGFFCNAATRPNKIDSFMIN
jgi:hypothetical protein